MNVLLEYFSAAFIASQLVAATVHGVARLSLISHCIHCTCTFQHTSQDIKFCMPSNKFMLNEDVREQAIRLKQQTLTLY